MQVIPRVIQHVNYDKVRENTDDEQKLHYKQEMI